ncbi:MFS transporter [Francisella sp. 19X1-34]|uniref:MFS transporter n=1 Tax=Francisella sp. 19X1-34 TaxID=3087177 RepID=UPI002E34F334|nr:MFS transporter [Francisella sp. 19X1-34]MED7788526.1 MFS transporter [Francisella sp. 19X1-34]
MELKKKDIFNYSFIALPVAFASIPIYIFLPDYYHTNYAINLTLLSIVLFMLRCLDAVLDPFIGWYCDRFHKLSKISLVIVILAFIIGVYIMCVPIFSNKILNLSIGIFLSTFAFSYITIFSITKGALWLKDDNGKSIIIGAREISNIIGVLTASVLLSIFLIYLPSRQGYFLYAIVSIILIMIASIFFFKWLDKASLTDNNTQKIYSFNIKNYINHFDKQGVLLFIVYTISAVGSTLPAVTLVFFSKYVLDTPNFTGVYLFTYFLGAIIFIPIIKKLALKFGILKVWAIVLILYALVFSFVFLLSAGQFIAFTLICLFAGAGLAAELILPSILLAKWIDSYPERRELGNGYYAILAFIGKLSFAIATIITFPIISYSTPENLDTILRLIYCILPCLAKVLAALIILIFYKKVFIEK